MSESSRLNPKAELRLAALIALVSVIFLWPIQAFYIAEHALPALMLVYALHTLVAGSVLFASFRVVSARAADRLTLLFTLGLTANLLLYLYLLPFAVPTYPSLISNALTCLLIAGAVLFSWSTRRMLTISLATCAGFAAVGATLSLHGAPVSPFALTLTWLGIGAALAVTCARVLGRFRASLMRRQTELAALSARLMSVQEEQLKSLSRELHDELGQSLTAVSSYLWLVERQLPEDLQALRTRTAEARQLVAKTLGQMRELSRLLRPPVLDLSGLGASLEEHLKAFGERHQIATSFAADGIPERLPAEIEIAVYRITQEALTNVARHSQATQVRVSLAVEGPELALAIEDDGVGLPAARDARPGVGLIGIRERVLALGGTIAMSAGPGLRLGVRVPLPPGAVPAT